LIYKLIQELSSFCRSKNQLIIENRKVVFANVNAEI